MVTAGRAGYLRNGLQRPELRTMARTTLTFLSGLLVIVVTSWSTVHYGSIAVAAGVAAAAATIAIQQRAFGVLLGMAALIDLNGIPGVNVNSGGVAISRIQDACTVVLLVALLMVVATGNVAKRSTLQRMLYVASFALAAWWLFTWVRTATAHGVPPILAARFARDFLFFALTLPLLCDVFVTYPRLRRQVLWTVGTGACLYAAAEIVQSRGHVSLDFMLHPLLHTVVQGTTRVYSPMNGLVRAAFALSVGALILAPSPRLRRWAILPTVLFGASILLQLTRAAYFGAAVGFVVAGGAWWFRRGPIRAMARKQLILVPVLALIVLGAGAALSAAERHLFSTAATRALAGYSDVSNATGTVAVRVKVSNEMLSLLGPDWPIGLGFVHPAVHYYAALPKGSIRNSDVGVMNALMLMGAIGAILIYLPLLLVLRSLIRAPPLADSDEQRHEWLRLGASIWIVAVIASSVTLVDLFSFGGLQLSALLLAMAASVAVSPGQQPQWSSAQISAPGGARP